METKLKNRSEKKIIMLINYHQKEEATNIDIIKLENWRIGNEYGRNEETREECN